MRAGQHVIAIGRGAHRPGCRVIDHRFDRVERSDIGACEVLLHFAGMNDTSFRDEKEFHRVNVEASLVLMRKAIAMGCRRIVYASSMHVYGTAPCPLTVAMSSTRPITPYGRSKLQLEQAVAELATEHGITCIGLRFANVYGPGEAHKGRMASQILQIARQMRIGDPEIFHPGTQVRDFIYVDDAATASIAAARVVGALAHTILNCGTGQGTSFNEIVVKLNAALGLSRTPRYVAEPPGYLSDVVLDIAPTVAMLRWRPRALDAGIADYIASGEFV